MLSTDFAPNEQWDDALFSLRLMFQPWKWYHGTAIKQAGKQLQSYFSTNSDTTVHFSISGRGALYQLLKALDLPQNTQVIVQAFTCEAVILPVLANHLTPVYCDIEEQTFSIDPVQLTKALNSNTKVIILQHTFGIYPHREKILKIAEKNSLIVIEDLAHGWDMDKMKQSGGESYKILSFGRSKAFSSVTGGAVISPKNYISQKLATQEKSLRSIGSLTLIRYLLYKPLSVLIKKTYDIFLGKILLFFAKNLQLISPELSQKEKRGVYDEINNFSFPNALAVLLIHQLNKYDQIYINRKILCDNYNRIFSVNHAYSTGLLRYPLIVKNRGDVLKKMQKQNIFLGKWYDTPIAPKGIDLEIMRYKKGSCPVAEKLCAGIVNLPTTHCHSAIPGIYTTMQWAQLA
ncbi:aminotransferase class I/II-fold pyridoxal phosphate-dependent enzyme [Candidatus Roizmanbacteria bacterium]|nr:aminotransferase class I/II-fold pyridoxal phosphate-dependent enzyme [Candidatus Roizmanbacteria bacterium]